MLIHYKFFFSKPRVISEREGEREESELRKNKYIKSMYYIKIRRENYNSS
jgi:hypothetical protein